MSKHQLAKREPEQLQRYAYEPGNRAEGVELAQWIFQSSLCPSNIKCAEDVFLVLMTGREFGMSAMQSLRLINVIERKPGLSADGMAGLVQSSDLCDFWRLVKTTDTEAIFETLRTGHEHTQQMSYTMDMARKSGNTNKNNWRQHPAAMLRARCITALARAVYPDIVAGLYDPDEITGEPVKVPAQRPARAPAPRSGEELAQRMLKTSRAAEAKGRVIDVDKIAVDVDAQYAESQTMAGESINRQLERVKTHTQPEPAKSGLLSLPGVGTSRAEALKQIGIETLEQAAEWITSDAWVSHQWVHRLRVEWFNSMKLKSTERDELWHMLQREHGPADRLNCVLEFLVATGHWNESDNPYGDACQDLDRLAAHHTDEGVAAAELSAWELAGLAIELRDLKSQDAPQAD